MDWSLVLGITTFTILAIGTFVFIQELRADVLAERRLVEKLSKDPGFLNEIRRQEIAKLINHEMSKSECEAASAEIGRLHRLIMDQLSQLDSFTRWSMEDPLCQRWGVGRAR